MCDPTSVQQIINRVVQIVNSSGDSGYKIKTVVWFPSTIATQNPLGQFLTIYATDTSAASDE